nr:DUF5753 domain-containing protein [Saccharopolyspora erythraea]
MAPDGGVHPRVFQGRDSTLSEAELDKLVVTRMSRQILLSRPRPPQYLAVFDENVLRRAICGPAAMKRQLQHLLTVSEASNVTMRVVPRSAGAYDGLYGAFLLLEYQEEPDIVFVENHVTALFLAEEADLASYRMALRNILGSALAPAATRDLISSVAAEH